MENLALILRTLIIAEASGVINPDELVYLNKMRHTYPAVKNYSDRLNASLESLNVEVYDPGTSVELLVSKIWTQRRTKSVLYVSAFAACLLFIVMLVKRTGEPDKVTVAARANAYLVHDKDSIALTGTQAYISYDNMIQCDNKKFRLTFHRSEPMEIFIPDTRQITVTLGDSTSVTLGPSSSLRFQQRETGGRYVEVSGEAYFDVKKDAERPFIVQLPDAEIYVLGTRFNVNTYRPKSPSAALVSGSIRLVHDNTQTMLTPGEEAVWTDEAIQLQKFDNNRALGWMQGKIVIPKATTADVIAAAKRYFDANLIIGPSKQSKVCNIAFDTHQPVTKFLKNYATAIEGIFYYENDTYYVK